MGHAELDCLLNLNVAESNGFLVLQLQSLVVGRVFSELLLEDVIKGSLDVPHDHCHFVYFFESAVPSIPIEPLRLNDFPFCKELLELGIQIDVFDGLDLVEQRQHAIALLRVREDEVLHEVQVVVEKVGV